MAKIETMTYASSAKLSSITKIFQTISQHYSSYWDKIKIILMHTSATRNFPAYKIKEFYVHNAKIKSLLKPHNNTNYKKYLINITNRWQ